MAEAQALQMTGVTLNRPIPPAPGGQRVGTRASRSGDMTRFAAYWDARDTAGNLPARLLSSAASRTPMRRLGETNSSGNEPLRQAALVGARG